MESNSKSTDKLMALSVLIDKTIDKLPPDKVSKIKTLEIKWVDFNEGTYRSDHPLPTMKLEFHE